ncbi:hypothetical protein K456DRAFT_59538 [Colletotrichum gloeosporioides 23]|nr:hypothetical protein K456DRAFT_59538 [Colletotrichum gloeosporioides 23]
MVPALACVALFLGYPVSPSFISPTYFFSFFSYSPPSFPRCPLLPPPAQLTRAFPPSSFPRRQVQGPGTQPGPPPSPKPDGCHQPAPAQSTPAKSGRSTADFPHTPATRSLAPPSTTHHAPRPPRPRLPHTTATRATKSASRQSLLPCHFPSRSSVAPSQWTLAY